MREFYENNEDFKGYVDRYAAQRKITVDEALAHASVREAYDYYRTEVKTVRLPVDNK